MTTDTNPGAAYAALPDGVATLCEYGGDVFTAAQMRAYADATHALRAPHGQAPAQPECLTCNDHGAVGNILTAEPCPDCTRKAAPTAVAGPSDDETQELPGIVDKALNELAGFVKFLETANNSWGSRTAKNALRDIEWFARRKLAAAPTTQPAPQPSPAAQGDALDAARWHWLAEYLVGPRTDLDDEIVASETVDDLKKLVDAARAAQEGKSHD